MNAILNAAQTMRRSPPTSGAGAAAQLEVYFHLKNKQNTRAPMEEVVVSVFEETTTTKT